MPRFRRLGESKSPSPLPILPLSLFRCMESSFFIWAGCHFASEIALRTFVHETSDQNIKIVPTSRFMSNRNQPPGRRGEGSPWHVYGWETKGTKAMQSSHIPSIRAPLCPPVEIVFWIEWAHILVRVFSVLKSGHLNTRNLVDFDSTFIRTRVRPSSVVARFQNSLAHCFEMKANRICSDFVLRTNTQNEIWVSSSVRMESRDKRA